MRRFKPITRDMDYLFPPSMNDWLPEPHLARFIVEIVDQLDLSQLERAYGDRGSDAFHPATLLSILLYGYATGGGCAGPGSDQSHRRGIPHHENEWRWI